MTQTPQTPPGWYPQGGQERWWDGTQWSDNFRPIQPLPAPDPTMTPATGTYQPVGYGAPQAYVAPQPGNQSHWLRNCLIVFVILLVLGIGGCTAAVFVVKGKVDDKLNNQTPCRVNVALTITPGQAFSCDHFDYAAGWAVQADSAGDATVTHLQVTNHRSKADFLFVHIDLREGNTVLATINCQMPNGSRLGKGDQVTLTCDSTDALPTSYDRVTINDTL